MHPGLGTGPHHREVAGGATMPHPSGVTELLARADGGDVAAQAELYVLVEPVLRSLALARKRASGAGQEVETTALIDDAFLKLVGRGASRWTGGDREKFYAFASAKMHDLLIEELRRRLAGKRNEGRAPAPLDGDIF